MFDGWRNVALGEVATFLSGGTPSKSEQNYWGGEIPWISAKAMKNLYLFDSEDRITSAAIKNGSKLIEENTTLLLVRGMTLLNDVPICMAKRKMSFNQDIKALVPNENIDSYYLTYMLLAHKQELLGMVDLAGHGTGRLNTQELKNFIFSIPDLTAKSPHCNTKLSTATLDR